MTQVIAIVDSNTLSVVDWYFSDSPIVPVTPGIRLEVPEGLTWDVVKGVQDSEGTVSLVPDPAKVQAKLDQAWTALRTERNRRLAASDWTQLVDSHLSQEKKDAWAAYRQELRDLPDELANTVPEGAGPPDLFEWPPVPGSVPVAPVTGSRLSNLLGGV
jgi:hypothetical protein